MENKKRKAISIAWIHNFDRNENPASGVFMYQFYEVVKGNDINISLVNVGNINNPFSFIKKFVRYKQVLKKYDIVHAQYGSGIGFFASFLNNKKILSLRGSDWYFSPSRGLKEKIHTWLGCKLTRWSVKRYDQIIVMSDRMKSEIQPIYPNLNIVVIPDGVDLNKFYPMEKESKKTFRVLFSSVDKANPLKRYGLALKSFNIFKEKYSDAELIFMTGVEHNKVNKLINSVDVILLTSTHEGWPNIIKEGLACNVPFVSTDVSDLKVLALKTKTCHVCDVNPVSIANALEKIAEKKDSEYLREFAQPFEIGQVGNELIKIYKKFSS